MNEQKPTDEREWKDIDRPTMPDPQEEFISEQARPSIDISELSCAQCGKLAVDWVGKGVVWEGHNFCSERCKSIAEIRQSR